jgi:hypothetical protein
MRDKTTSTQAPNRYEIARSVSTGVLNGGIALASCVTIAWALCFHTLMPLALLGVMLAVRFAWALIIRVREARGAAAARWATTGWAEHDKALRDPAYNKRFPKRELIALGTIIAGILVLAAVGHMNARNADAVRAAAQAPAVPGTMSQEAARSMQTLEADLLKANCLWARQNPRAEPIMDRECKAAGL